MTTSAWRTAAARCACHPAGLRMASKGHDAMPDGNGDGMRVQGKVMQDQVNGHLMLDGLIRAGERAQDVVLADDADQVAARVDHHWNGHEIPDGSGHPGRPPYRPRQSHTAPARRGQGLTSWTRLHAGRDRGTSVTWAIRAWVAAWADFRPWCPDG